MRMENNETILVKTQENSYQAIAKIYAQLTQLQYTEKHRIGLGEEEASLLMPFPKRATNGRRADVEEIGTSGIVSVILHFGGIELKFRIFLNLKMKKEKTSRLHYLQGSNMVRLNNFAEIRILFFYRILTKRPNLRESIS
ncbi:hypothetical protein ACJX0J_035741 [Zea mays]